MGKMYTRPSIEMRRGQSEEFVRATTVIVGPSDTCDFIVDGVADAVTIDLALAYALSIGGGEVVLMEFHYVLADSINIPGNGLILRGFGVATFIDGDALGDNEHAIVLSGFTDCVIRDLSIQTNDGGDLNCDCIFIEDGADRFLIDNVTFIDSDRFGVNIEGTAITVGAIVNCTFIDTDAESVYGNPDAANNHTYIRIENNYLASSGQGAWAEFGAVYVLARCNYWTVTGNIFVDNDLGVTVEGDGWTITGNILVNTGVGAAVNIWSGSQHSIVGNIAYNTSADVGYDIGGTLNLVTGNVAFGGDNAGFQIGGHNCVVSGNLSSGNEQHGIAVNGDYNNISGNISYNNRFSNAVNGINVAASAANTVICGNHIYLNEGDGIDANGPRTLIVGNYVFENGEFGLNCNSDDGSVVGNMIHDNSQTTAGARDELLVNSPRILVSGNHCTSPGDSSEHCIRLLVANCLIIGNFCYNGMGSGIEVSAAADNCLISGNYLMDNDDYGIEIAAATAENNMVIGNYAVGNGAGPRLDAGTSTYSVNNWGGGIVETSNGWTYSTIQLAVTGVGANGWVYVPLGTWSESVTMAQTNVILFGGGWGSIIDGGVTGHAIAVTNSGCIIRDLTVKTDVGQGNDYDGIASTGADLRIINVFGNGADRHNILSNGTRTTILSCFLFDADQMNIYVESGGDNTNIDANQLLTSGDDGVYINGTADNCIVDGNRISGWTNEAIDDDSGTSVIGDNNTT